MRISDVTLWHVSVPLPAPFYPSWIPGLPQTENRFTLVRLRTASGLEGWSAGPAMDVERQGLGALLGPYLLDERADDLASIRQRLREMTYLGWHVGWLEAACWDVIGKARGVPVWQLLVGGFFVGYGARLGNGCTSGHGICGLGSLQWPSLLAVLTFMATAFLTANLAARWLA